MASSFTCAPQTTRIEPWRGVPDMPTQVAACVGRSWAGGWPAQMQCLYDSSSQTGIDFSIRSLSCDRSHDKWSMQSRCITFLTTVPLDDVTTSSSRRGIHSIGINRRLFLGSTVGSFADQPSALSPVTKSTIERTNTRDVGVRPEFRRRRTPARRSRSNGIGELVCAANDRAAFLFSCLAI
jgi:hypothetical protein